MTEIRNIEGSLLEPNTGQVEGLPRNPRFIRDNRFRLLKKSMEECPEMLSLRELIVYPHEGKYVIIGGHHKFKAGKELGMKEYPCKILDPGTPAAKLREIASKDNLSFAENDMDIMEHEWDRGELEDWGIEFAPEKPRDEFKERFEALTDETAIYPLVPKYDERHELIIIQSASEVDTNWLREVFGMQRMASYKTGKIGKSNVIDIKDVRAALEGAKI